MTRKLIGSLVIFLAIVAVSKCFEGPVIGILTEEMEGRTKRAYPEFNSYIAASYVKAVQGSGGRVVPLLINKTEEYYRKQMAHLNGIIFPGGACLFTARHGYAEAGAHIYAIAQEYNNKGDYFPILGVCLGFELFLFISNNNIDCRIPCQSENRALPLNFMGEYNESKLFGKANNEILNILGTLPVTSNHHRTCVTPNNFKAAGLNTKWKILSLNNDDNGITFVSSIESIHYPFAAIQFHPEKNMYEWKKSQNNPHSRKAILSARYFYDWLIHEASKNAHTFPSDKEKSNELIENYPIFYSDKKGLSFQEIYLFH